MAEAQKERTRTDTRLGRVVSYANGWLKEKVDRLLEENRGKEAVEELQREQGEKDKQLIKDFLEVKVDVPQKYAKEVAGLGQRDLARLVWLVKEGLEKRGGRSGISGTKINLIELVVNQKINWYKEKMKEIAKDNPDSLMTIRVQYAPFSSEHALELSAMDDMVDDSEP